MADRNCDSPLFNYRLNAQIDYAADQGIIPHLLAAAELSKRSTATYLILGANIALSGGGRAEIDLFGLCDGKVVAGEAKASPQQFTEAQLERDIKLSTLLRADAHLVVCGGVLSSDLLESANRLAGDVGLELIAIDENAVRSS